ncbi:hypothetical protein OHB39_39495 [Streptomyces sp. NBC_00047]|uniref:hypothetical protein n=1 Tax=Streptomyces sp. NBC_00047 TaxID=2975627 RepID=UPI00224CF5EE|nr:hypothetical protein [Streptomyces sp. NBC_00047]MCX5613526.1 hypothetical protein [Streptomyces sp. NBC_00047]
MLAMLLPVAWSGTSTARAEPPGGDQTVFQESAPISVAPTLAGDFKPARQVTPEERRAMQDTIYRMRLDQAAIASKARGIPAGSPAKAPASRFDSSAPHARGTAQDGLVIARNHRNFAATSNACGDASVLAEPAAANDGRHVFYSGNFSHQEFSTDRGASYTCAEPYPAGPAEAPVPFGDTDVIYDQARDVTFHSAMYLNDQLSNGIVRVFVRRSIPQPDNCYYDVDFDPAATNVVPDYPHLGISKKHLYVNANRVSGSWLGAAMARLSLDDLAACRTASGRSINITNDTSRILVPGHGARNVMYFGWVNTPTQWRLFSWPDNATAVGSTLHNVSAMTFGNADCRGGANNLDWADTTEAEIVGFNVRTAITKKTVNVWAATDADSVHPNAHITGAEFRVGASPNDLRLIQEPVIAFADRCAGEPSVGVNDRGAQGLAIAGGGRNGGGGPAVTTGVGIKDEQSPGPGGFNFRQIAEATHNPLPQGTDPEGNPRARFGDYFTVRRNSPCGNYFDATGYGLLNGTDVSNVNARYVEFGRGDYCDEE